MPLNKRVTQWNSKVVWIIGASSGIGQATAQSLVKRGAIVYASARNEDKLKELASTYQNLYSIALDIHHAEAIQKAAKKIQEEQKHIDIVLYCVGYYTPQDAKTFDLTVLKKHQEVNYTGALNTLDAVLPILLKQQSGHISLISSVAGYRGLPKALGYGPTKAALQNLADILYLDLHPQGIGVSIINPGFVATPLTEQNDFKMPALLKPEEAANCIIRGFERGAFEIHFPKRFTLVLKFLQWLPTSLYFLVIRKLTG
jgi:short-subunit dehydrogenase